MSSSLVWSPRLALNVPEIDRQHQGLVEQMGRLEALSRGAGTRAQILEAFTALGAATTKHFAEEEQYMARIGFPGLTAHRESHAKLLEAFGGHLQRYKAATAREVDSKVFDFLSVWLRGHILGVDRQYASFGEARTRP